VQRVIGRVVDIQPFHCEGLHATIRVANTPLGNETVELCADQALAPSVGFQTAQEHDLQEELYLVQRGRATFELDGERVDAPAGTLVFARPAVKRTAFAEEPGTTIVALGGTPGKAYEAQGGEIWMPLHHLYDSGQYAEAADQGRELIEAHPEYAGPLYNLACCESLAGRTDDAIRHLRLAIDGKESFRSLAAEDSDFDPIRDEAAFKELVQGNAGEPTTG
jgi:tetratricopeptide (TPR) repeat protein